MPSSPCPTITSPLPAPQIAGGPSGVVTRSGQTVPFDQARIRSAIERAGQASGEFGADEAELLAIQAVKVLRFRFPDQAPQIEQIQDVVEQVLISANYVATVRAYIVYREQHARLRKTQETVVDVVSSIEDYLGRTDWRVSANANQGYSLGGLILNASGKLIANYWLSHVYPPEVDRAHREGDLHIHDLDMLAGYCAGWSLRMLLQEGLNGVPGKIDCGPPRHLSSAVSQIVNFLGTLQNEWAGAQAFSSFDTYLAPYVRSGPAQLCRRSMQAIQELVLQPERAVSLGHPDAVHQPDLRLDLSGGSARAGADHRRGGGGVHLR